ncbi:hypothetical protein BUZ81_12690, partial [Staphylococcus saprophyticus]
MALTLRLRGPLRAGRGLRDGTAEDGTAIAIGHGLAVGAEHVIAQVVANTPVFPVGVASCVTHANRIPRAPSGTGLAQTQG